jgi:hypothetical protein
MWRVVYVIKNLENEEAKARYRAVKIQPKGCNAKKSNKKQKQAEISKDKPIT